MDGPLIERQISRLANSIAGTGWLAAQGIDWAFARRWGIGLEAEDEDGMTLVHRARSRTGDWFLSRLRVTSAGSALPVVPGLPGSHWSCVPSPGSQLLILPDMPSLWRMEQAVADLTLTGFVAVARLHGRGIPTEWSDPGCWAGFERVVAVVDDIGHQRDLGSAILQGAGERAHFALPPSGGSWAASFVQLAPLDGGMLQGISDAAAPVGRLLGCPSSTSRVDHDPVDTLCLDRHDRMMRLLRVEEREPEANGGRGPERWRTRDIVIRSDAQLLDVLEAPAPAGTARSDRLLTLSDGTRLLRRPPCGSRAAWSLDSAMAYVAARGAPPRTGEADHLLHEVEGALRADCGLAGSALRQAALFVMSSYVYQAMPGLAVPLFAGSASGHRLSLIRALSKLCHAPTVVGRSRARSLARVSDETGGAILFDEPGALAGPLGPTELGRFVSASCTPGLSCEHVVERGGRRPLATFGPRAIFTRHVPPWHCDSVRVVRLDDQFEPRLGREPPGRQAIVDRLYTWSMSAVPALLANGTTAGLVPAELLEFGREAAGSHDPARLDTSSVRAATPHPKPWPAPEELMEASYAACVRNGAAQVSITQLILEAAVRGGVGEAFTPERVGRWLAATRRIAPGVPSTRRRLFGHICRIYSLADGADGAVGSEQDPFDFCISAKCGECRFGNVCEAAVPGLKSAKARSARPA